MSLSLLAHHTHTHKRIKTLVISNDLFHSIHSVDPNTEKSLLTKEMQLLAQKLLQMTSCGGYLFSSHNQEEQPQSDFVKLKAQDLSAEPAPPQVLQMASSEMKISSG